MSEGKKDDLITVFTPTYNRMLKIKDLMNSLAKQTFKNFEWIIVDNGSDETYKTVEQFMKNNRDIRIRYVKQERGLHNAINKGIEIANGKYFFRVDDDDILPEDALEKIINMLSTIKDDLGFAGIAGLKTYHDGTIVGQKWLCQDQFIDATNLERDSYGLNGDKAEVYYTEVLRDYYPLPFFENEYCGFEAILWNRIAVNGLKLRWFNEPIYICKYYDDGLTQNAKKIYQKNLKTYSVYISELISYKQIKSVLRFKSFCRYFECIHNAKQDSDLYYHFFACSYLKFKFVEMCSYLTKFL